jgi:hypothetical protein
MTPSDSQTQTATLTAFLRVCLVDGIAIPPHLRAELEIELSTICQHLELVRGAVEVVSDPANVFRPATIEQS